ncbi:MAG: hypothetical protein FWH55_08080 [Oscillospiraceae bacterium]|nr:hypothetical protein [Oscillospiraceae bacterium]
MPKIWLPNFEDVALQSDPTYGATFSPEMLSQYYCRSLFWLSPNDKIVLPCSIDLDYANYVAQLCGFHRNSSWLLQTTYSGARKFNLSNSILLNDEVLTQLRKLAGTECYTVEPYIESTYVSALCKSIRIPLTHTSTELVESGLIDRLNDKVFFKELSNMLGIRTVSSRHFYEKESLLTYLGDLGLEKICIKKAFHSGGRGNIVGEAQKVIEQLALWYECGAILVEPYIEFIEVVGSLAYLTEQECTFLGVDLHISEGGCWKGFSYPYHDTETANTIETLTMLYAERIHRMGVRGYLNVDWGISRDGIYALEINMRHNGFWAALSLGTRFFKSLEASLQILYIENFPVNQNHNTQSIISALARVRADNAPLLVMNDDAVQGAVLMTPPRCGYLALALFGSSVEFLLHAKALVEQTIA